MAQSGIARTCDTSEQLMPDNVFGTVVCQSFAQVVGGGDWQFQSYRSGTHHRLAWAGRGGGKALINGRPVGFGPQTGFFLGADDVVGFELLRGSDGYMVSIPRDLELQAPDQSCVVRLSRLEESVNMGALFQSFVAEHQRGLGGREEMLRAHLVILTIWIDRLRGATPMKPEGARHALLRRFLQRVEDDYLNHLQVSHYAEQLQVTPTHLSRVCREITGKSASALIQDRLMLQARLALSGSSDRVTKIAYDLGFADPAYFTRVFTARTGTSPTEFRRALPRLEG